MPRSPTKPAARAPLRLAGQAALVLATLGLIVPAAAAAQSTPQPFAPWDGTNPFKCLNQDVGTGTDFPDPGADPFCVEFDKTNQNITDLGIADFLIQEPGRVTAAGPKCFYFQHDHWTGSIVQGSEPEVWHWDGSYFFDKAKGFGGVYVANARVGAQPFDATPYAPPEYQPYFAPGGGGGVIYQLETDPDPACVALVDTPEEREDIYSSEPVVKKCIPPGGQIRGRRIGKVRLGMSKNEVWRRLGPPRNRKSYVHRWCVIGGSDLHVGFHKRDRPPKATNRGSGSPRAVSIIRTTNPGHHVDHIGPGSRRGLAIRRLELRHKLKVGHTDVFAAPRKHRYQLLVGIRGKHVSWLAITDPNRLPRDSRLRTALGNSR